VSRVRSVQGSAKSVALPDFIVLGAQKAATSSVYRVLKGHPDVRMPREKEIDFFSEAFRFRRGLESYARHFQGLRPGGVVGENSPGYLPCPACPGRIRAAVPQAKLVAVLRNPIERAYSSWRMQVLRGAETAPFFEALHKDPRYVAYGRYYQQLSRYAEFFPASQLLVLLFDELAADSTGFYTKLFAFISADVRRADPDTFRYRENEGGAARSSGVARLLKAGFGSYRALKGSPFRGLVENAFVDGYARSARNKLAHWNRWTSETAGEGLARERSATAWLATVFEEDVRHLSAFLGRDLTGWLDPYA